MRRFYKKGDRVLLVQPGRAARVLETLNGVMHKVSYFDTRATGWHAANELEALDDRVEPAST